MYTFKTKHLVDIEIIVWEESSLSEASLLYANWACEDWESLHFCGKHHSTRCYWHFSLLSLCSTNARNCLHAQNMFMSRLSVSHYFPIVPWPVEFRVNICIWHFIIVICTRDWLMYSLVYITESSPQRFTVTMPFLFSFIVWTFRFSANLHEEKLRWIITRPRFLEFFSVSFAN